MTHIGRLRRISKFYGKKRMIQTALPIKCRQKAIDDNSCKGDLIEIVNALPVYANRCLKCEKLKRLSALEGL